jgi:phosphohistidine phosphatase
MNPLYTNVFLFGHNNAITDFVNKFGDLFIPNVPTAGWVTIEFEAENWASITKGKTIRFITPSVL